MKILISGATGGIGKAICEQLLHAGHQLLALCRHPENIMIKHENYQPYAVDFADVKAIETTLKSILSQQQSLDAVIIAAGYGQFAQLEQWSFKAMQDMMQVNFLSQALLIKLCLPLLVQTENSKIIAIGSEAAHQGAKKGSMYCASKFALKGFIQSLRAECVSKGIAVSMVNPGMVATNFFNALNFTHGDAKENAIQAAQVADMVSLLMNTENNCVIEEINCQPLKKVIAKKESLL